MNTHHFTLKREWFDKIHSGEKPEEYREIKPYWAKRFLCDVSYHISINEPTIEQMCEMIKSGSKDIAYDFSVYADDQIQFYNGWACSKKYSNFKIQCLGMEVREGNPEWGAIPGVKYFVIKLGDKL